MGEGGQDDAGPSLLHGDVGGPGVEGPGHQERSTAWATTSPLASSRFASRSTSGWPGGRPGRRPAAHDHLDEVGQPVELAGAGAEAAVDRRIGGSGPKPEQARRAGRHRSGW